MSRRSFFLKLALFFGPLFALYALPVAVLVRAWELAPVSMIAAKHARSSRDAPYGPAYGYPARGYKLASVEVRQPEIVAVGSSRVMELRADFFAGDEATFYNAGGVVERLFDYRLVFQRLARMKTRRAIVGLDPWHFNEHWRDFAPDPLAPRDYDGDFSRLDIIQRSLRVYPDLRAKKFTLGDVFGGHEAFGINAMSHGNGFVRDGSYRYADLLRDPGSGEDFQFKDSLLRVATGTRRLEPSSEPSPRALAELELLASEWEARGFEVVVFLPPFAPIVVDAMRASGRLDYVFGLGPAMRPILERHHVTFVDFTSCGPLACRNEEFLDGMHGGSALYARMLLELARVTPWLSDRVDRASLEPRLERHAQEATSWDLARP